MGRKKVLVALGLVLTICASLLPALGAKAAVSKDTTWYFLASSDSKSLEEMVKTGKPSTSSGEMYGIYPGFGASNLLTEWPKEVVLGGANVILYDRELGYVRHFSAIPDDCVYGAVSLYTSKVDPDELERIDYTVYLYDVSKPITDKNGESVLEPVSSSEVSNDPIEMVNFAKLVPITNPNTQFYVVDKMVYALDGSVYHPGATAMVFQKNVKNHVLSFITDEEMEAETATVFRLLDPKTGKHLYTIFESERDYLVNSGWRLEPPLGRAFKNKGVAVYRLYNPRTGEHLYTTDTNEALYQSTNNGWVYDNDKKPVFYGADTALVPVYRLYNPKSKVITSHHYTSDTNEIRVLTGGTWRYDNNQKPMFYLIYNY